LLYWPHLDRRDLELPTLAKKGKKSGKEPALATNRSASFQYHLLMRVEAGMVLTGPEVKSARQGRVSLKEAYAKISDGEIFLHNAHFSPYSHARREDSDPRRVRKLLLNAREIRKLSKESEATGMTIVPTRMYLKNGRIKIEIALAKGKRLHDKRESKRRKEIEREIAREKSSRSIR
jgi:SsrA-binding protein